MQIRGMNVQPGDDIGFRLQRGVVSRVLRNYDSVEVLLKGGTWHTIAKQEPVRLYRRADDR